jgi:hypothetical protein
MSMSNVSNSKGFQRIRLDANLVIANLCMHYLTSTSEDFQMCILQIMDFETIWCFKVHIHGYWHGRSFLLNGVKRWWNILSKMKDKIKFWLFLYKQAILSLKNLHQNFEFFIFLPLKKSLVRSQSLDSLQVACIWAFFHIWVLLEQMMHLNEGIIWPSTH